MAVAGSLVVACGSDDLGLSDPLQVGTAEGGTLTSLADLAVCSRWVETLVSVELLRGEAVVWSATSPEEDAQVLGQPLLIGDLVTDDRYTVSGPIPNMEAHDVVRINSSGNFLGFSAGEITFSKAADLDCAGS